MSVWPLTALETLLARRGVLAKIKDGILGFSHSRAKPRLARRKSIGFDLAGVRVSRRNGRFKQSRGRRIPVEHHSQLS
jgi:hypothetical protein